MNTYRRGAVFFILFLLHFVCSFFSQLVGLELQIADFAAGLFGIALNDADETQNEAAAADETKGGEAGESAACEQQHAAGEIAYGVGHVVLAFEKALKLALEVSAHILSSAFFIQHISTLFSFSVSLNDIIQTRTTGRILTPDFISFFGGRQPTCIIQFCLTLKSPPVVS